MNGDDFDDLCERWCRDELDATESSRLVQALRDDAALRSRLADAAGFDHALRSALGVAPDAESFLVGVASRLKPSRARRPAARRWWLPVSVAAAALLALGLWWHASAPSWPLVIGPGRVEPALAADGRLRPGQTVLTGEEPVRLAWPGGSTVLVRPHSSLMSTADGWRLDTGAMSVDLRSGSGPHPLAVATPHGRVRITGTVLHVTASADLAAFSCERGTVEIAAGAWSTGLTAGQTAVVDQAGGRLLAGGTALRAEGNVLYDESVIESYRRTGPLLAGGTGLVEGPVSTLTAEALHAAARTTGSLKLRPPEGGVLTCERGEGGLRVDLPGPLSSGLHARLQVRLEPGPQPQGVMITSALFPAITQAVTPPTWLRIPQNAPRDRPMIYDQWRDMEVRAIRVGCTATGLPLWEIRFQVGQVVFYAWSAGERPALIWEIARTGLSLRDLRCSELRRAP